MTNSEDRLERIDRLETVVEEITAAVQVNQQQITTTLQKIDQLAAFVRGLEQHL